MDSIKYIYSNLLYNNGMDNYNQVFSDKELETIKTVTNKSLGQAKKPTHKFNPLYLKIMEATSFLDDLPDATFGGRKQCILQNVTQIPKCPICSKTPKLSRDTGFNKYCSKECRDSVESHKLSKEVLDKLKDKEWLYDQRVVNKLSFQDIGDVLGVSSSTVSRAYSSLNIDDIPIHKSPETQDKLKYNYFKSLLDKGLSTKEISEDIGIIEKDVKLYLFHYGLITPEIKELPPRVIEKSVKDDLITKLIDYKKNAVNFKSINDKTITNALKELYPDIIDLNPRRLAKRRATLLLLDLDHEPLCECGNELGFDSPYRNSKYTSIYGSYYEHCCLLCMQLSKTTLERRRNTNIERYGVDSYAKLDSFKLKYSQSWDEKKKEVFNKKARETFMRRYGVEHQTKTQAFLDKRTETCLKLYGVENIFLSEPHREKMRQTLFSNYGVDSPLRSPEIVKKLQDTCLEKYGYRSAMQNSEVQERSKKKAYLLKDHRGFKLQGYEDRGLDYLLDILNIDPNDISNKYTEFPSIVYEHNGRNYVYFPDFYIKSLDLYIEIKSTWTWGLDNPRNLSKLNSVKNIQLWVFDEKSKIPLMFNHYSGFPDANMVI